ncbi:MAG: O-antigen ligase family protein [Candidatus Gottesmanbacteria bacterium]|nr:O-antigen ligase family protein [Candidatus Gottesmanbacteria bacterium]
MSIKTLIHWITRPEIVFFVFLTTSLFLGDGKQPFVDVWWALGILTMYGARYYQRGKLDFAPLPRPIGFGWMALILYYIILIPFSDSAGYSISATIRLIEGYLVYVLFLTLARDSRNQEPPDSGNQIVEFFIKGLLFIGVVATLASFVFLLFPALARMLPPMNLLYANYGHNHLADLLLFVFPVAIGLVEKKKNSWAIGELGLFSVGMILTLARGAWVLLVLYLFYVVLRSKTIIVRRVGLSIAVVIATALLVISLTSLKGQTHGVGLIGQLARQAQKTTLFEDNRWEYWRQAVAAIKERPLFGSGPGTFYLESRRLQSRPDNWSWFAHSFPLQAAAETGLVGLFLFSILIFFIVKAGLQKNVLWNGALLVLLYGSYEFSLDYSSIWILLCATLGTLARHKDRNRNPRQNIMIYGALIVLGMFYTSSFGGLIATSLNNKNAAFYLAPYDAKTAREIIGQENVVRFFHNKNPEILSWIVSIGTDEAAKQQARETLAVIDPWGNSAFAAVQYLLEKKLTERAAQIIILKQAHEKDAEERRGLSETMVRLGDEYYKGNKFSESGQWYKQAQKEDAWALDRYEPIFLRFHATIKEKINFFEALSVVPGSYLGKNREEYVHAWYSAIVDVVNVDNYVPVEKNIRSLGSIAPWRRNEFWMSLGLMLLEQSRKALKEGNANKAKVKALMLLDVYRGLSMDQPELDWGLREKASRHIMRLGNELSSYDLAMTEKLQDSAESMNPWIGKSISAWYKTPGVGNIPTSTLIAYLLQEDAKPGPWKNRSRSYAAVLLNDRLIEDGKPEEVFVYAKKIIIPDEINFETRKDLVTRIQKKADDLLAAIKVTDAEYLILSMKYLLPDDYWVQAQEGFFYLATGNGKKALDSFEKCVVVRTAGHKDCALGLQDAKGRTPYKKDRYGQISQIIQGKAQWTDF